ncbi:MAG: C10 family peptidase [Muribaculaceae bacterium]|nr:C10 family peptidase [Muribaculaceae bacterium]
MNIKNLINLCVLTCLTASSLFVGATTIDINTARSTASNYLKQYASNTPGTLRAPAIADIKLAYAEESSAISGANAYYAFNITGGGFIIVAGEDRAYPVLGYSDQGHLDYNNLPDNFKALMRGYKEEIEYLQAHPELNVTPALRTTRGTGVAPLTRTTWGQGMPYYLQCPIYNGEYCVVGCVATAMAQVMYYWGYPTSCEGVNSYYCYDIGQTIPALPSTTFDYSKMLLSYSHWDWDLGELIQDTYTDEQAQEVAKLSRYCGQAVDMAYSPEGSGAYVFSQLSAMQDFGYSDDAQDVSRDSWFWENYTTEEWEAMVREELDKRQPILYSASDPEAGGHAFVCDGYNSEGLFHFNFGWYGTCDGWYVSTALNMTHRDGDELHFNSNHEMLLGVVPPSYCVIQTDGFDLTDELLVLGENMPINVTNVNILTTNDNINLSFSLIDANGRKKATGNTVNIVSADFEQGSTISSFMTLPTTLSDGNYTLQFFYYISSPRLATRIYCESNTLKVVGHLAKYGAPFTINDVTTAIDWLLTGEKTDLTIGDVTDLIDVLLTGE